MATFGLKIPLPKTAYEESSAEGGFTLIELLVVIAICLIMASFALPAYNRIVARRPAGGWRRH